jgi:hypothetical protein
LRSVPDSMRNSLIALSRPIMRRVRGGGAWQPKR